VRRIEDTEARYVFIVMSGLKVSPSSPASEICLDGLAGVLGQYAAGQMGLQECWGSAEADGLQECWGSAQRWLTSILEPMRSAMLRQRALQEQDEVQRMRNNGLQGFIYSLEEEELAHELVLLPKELAQLLRLY
jgi:hypothetical protein